MKIKIIPNPKKPWAVKLAQRVKRFLGRKHRTVNNNADATVCIGGDGTILYANHQKRLGGRVLGIGGDKSYICQLHRNSWQSSLLWILEKGKGTNIMSLNCNVGKKNFTALNDFVIHATNYRVVEMDVSVNGRRTSFEGDGMIISSPLGSAAYAYSAGGKKLGPTERKISLVPICPYKRAFSPKILNEKDTISVRVGSDCAFIIDGIFVRHLRKNEIVRIKKGSDIPFFEGVGRNDI